jgi:hypothetical protein
MTGFTEGPKVGRFQDTQEESMGATARTPRRSATQRAETAKITATPASGAGIQKRQLEKSVSWTGRERLRCLWYRLRLTVAEMNYATRRTVELQAPWISDDHPAPDAETD